MRGGTIISSFWLMMLRVSAAIATPSKPQPNLTSPSRRPVPEPTNDLSPQSLVDFNKAGGNIVFGYSPSRADWFRDLAREFSLELAPAGHRLVDHFSQSSKSDGRLALPTRSETGESALVKDNAVFAGDAALAEEEKRGNAILAKDVAPHIVGDNPLAFPLVKPSSTSYLAGSDGQPLWLGTDKDLSIISAFQLRDSSARVAFIGSQDLLSDDALLSTSSSSNMNSALLTSLLTWTFQERSVLRIDRRTHYRVRSSPTDVREPYEEPAEGGSASMYRIKDNVRYAIDVAQHDPQLGWIAAPKDLDLQVSLNMIDPFITVKLAAEDEAAKTSLATQLPPAPAQSNITTRYSTTLRLPDRLGVYTFRLKWFRHGWTYFDDVKDVAPIRAFNHDEGERFLPASWPYAAASFSTIGGFLVFVVLWVLGGDEEVKRAKGE